MAARSVRDICFVVLAASEPAPLDLDWVAVRDWLLPAPRLPRARWVRRTADRGSPWLALVVALAVVIGLSLP